MCRRYCQRPSSVIGIADSWTAFDFDLAMAAIHRVEDDSRVSAMAEANPTLALLNAVLR